MSGFAGLALIIASIMPEKELLEQVEEKIVAYKLTGNSDDRDKLRMYMQLFLSKEMVEKEGVENVMKEMDQIKSIHDRLKTKDA